MVRPTEGTHEQLADPDAAVDVASPPAEPPLPKPPDQPSAAS